MGGLTFSATPATTKLQVYIAKGSAPWYNTGYISWPDKDKVISIDKSVSGQATVTCKGVTDMGGMFIFLTKLTSIDLSNFDTFNVTTMSNMFGLCSNLASIDLSNFDTSNVEDMTYMFYNCSSLTTIKGVIDMKSCTNYTDMFKNCTKLTGVKIKNPPSDFESKTGLSSSQYTIVS